MVNLNTSLSFRREINGVIGAINALMDKGNEPVRVPSRDASPLLHAITVGTVAGGKDITVTLHHAAGEVKRIVVQGDLTVESFIAKLRNLTGTHGVVNPGIPAVEHDPEA